MGKTKPEKEVETTQPTPDEALKAENEALKAKLAALEAQMKPPETAGEAPPGEEEKVEIFVPRGYANDEPNLLISINGVNYLLPKGKSSTVPKHVADEFYRSRKAQTAMDDRISQMIEASK